MTVTGETVEISRRDEVVATITAPAQRRRPDATFAEEIRHWRTTWDVEDWPDDDPFEDVRDPSPGRDAPW